MATQNTEYVKLIPVSSLKVGMHIHDINCGWMDHKFVTNSLTITDSKILQLVKDTGVKEVYIDTSKGEDSEIGMNSAAVEKSIDEDIAKIDNKPISIEKPPVQSLTGIVRHGYEEGKEYSLETEHDRAKKLVDQAGLIMRDMFSDLRLGKQINMQIADEVVDNLIDSIFRKQDAVTPLLRLKDHDEYTFKHSVSVCTLLVAFGKGLGLPRETIRELAVGGLLHDVGKAKIPDEILNKPAKLTDAEFAKMKSHVVQSIIILQNTEGITKSMLEIAGQHHERYDGTGYPNGLAGEGISFYGRMGAIVDVYDALTSDRVYHKGMPPTEALRKMLEWSKNHFDAALVQTFIKVLGIYPTGSFVLLDSHRIGIVKEQGKKSLLTPTVLVFFDSRRNRYIQPELVNTAKERDKITMHIDPDQYNIDKVRWTEASV